MAELPARGPGPGARPSRGALGESRSRSTSANSAKSVVTTFVWMLLLPSTWMFSFERREGAAGLGGGVEDGDDLTQRPTEPQEFADDQAVPAQATQTDTVH